MFGLYPPNICQNQRSYRFISQLAAKVGLQRLWQLLPGCQTGCRIRRLTGGSCASAVYKAQNFSVASCFAACASSRNRLCSFSARVALTASHVLITIPKMRTQAQFAPADIAATRLRPMHFRNRYARLEAVPGQHRLVPQISLDLHRQPVGGFVTAAPIFSPGISSRSNPGPRESASAALVVRPGARGLWW